MRKIVLFSAIYLGLTLAMGALASAEYLCEAKVGYTVELIPKQLPAVARPAPAARETPLPIATEVSKENTVYLSVVEGRGTDEASAKAAVQKESGRHIGRVRDECRVRHENVGGCIASKFQTNGSVLRGLGFQARKALEEALQGDCESQRGICKKTEITEPVCREIIAKAVESASPEAESKGKDDKKKAKK